jgi:hypothetical protein
LLEYFSVKEGNAIQEISNECMTPSSDEKQVHGDTATTVKEKKKHDPSCLLRELTELVSRYPGFCLLAIEIS